MKVKELIECLSKQNPEIEVLYSYKLSTPYDKWENFSTIKACKKEYVNNNLKFILR